MLATRKGSRRQYGMSQSAVGTTGRALNVLLGSFPRLRVEPGFVIQIHQPSQGLGSVHPSGLFRQVRAKQRRGLGRVSGLVRLATQ